MCVLLFKVKRIKPPWMASHPIQRKKTRSLNDLQVPNDLPPLLNDFSVLPFISFCSWSCTWMWLEKTKLSCWNSSALPLKCTLRAAWKCTRFPKTIHQSHLGGNFTTLSLQALHFPHPIFHCPGYRFRMPLYWENGKHYLWWTYRCIIHIIPSRGVIETSPMVRRLKTPYSQYWKPSFDTWSRN